MYTNPNRPSRFAFLGLLALLAVLLCACSPGNDLPASAATPTPSPSATSLPAASPTASPDAETTPTAGGILMVHGKAHVDSIDVTISQSLPTSVQVVAKGYLPDGCTRLDQTTQTLNGTTFEVTITTQRPANMMCSQIVKPFEQTITLDTAGLKSSAYTVTVNGVSKPLQLP